MILEEQFQVVLIEGVQYAARGKEPFKVLQCNIPPGVRIKGIVAGQILLEGLIHLAVPLMLELRHRLVQNHPPAFRGQPGQQPVQGLRLVVGHALQGEDRVGSLQAHAGPGSGQRSLALVWRFLDVAHVLVKFRDHQHDLFKPGWLIAIFSGQLVELRKLPFNILQHAEMRRLLQKLPGRSTLPFRRRHKTRVMANLPEQTCQGLVAAGQALQNTYAVVQVLKPLNIDAAQGSTPGLGIVLGIKGLQTGQQSGFIRLAEVNVVPAAQHPGVHQSQLRYRAGLAQEPFFQSLPGQQRGDGQWVFFHRCSRVRRLAIAIQPGEHRAECRPGCPGQFQRCPEFLFCFNFQIPIDPVWRGNPTKLMLCPLDTATKRRQGHIGNRIALAS